MTPKDLAKFVPEDINSKLDLFESHEEIMIAKREQERITRIQVVSNLLPSTDAVRMWFEETKKDPTNLNGLHLAISALEDKLQGLLK